VLGLESDSGVVICASDVSTVVSACVDSASDVGFISVTGTWVGDGVLIGASVDSDFCVGVDTVSSQPTRINKKQKIAINAVILFITNVIVVKGDISCQSE